MTTSGTHGKDRSRPCQTSHPAVYIRQLVQSAYPLPLCTILTSTARCKRRGWEVQGTREIEMMKSVSFLFLPILIHSFFFHLFCCSNTNGPVLIWKSGLCSDFNWAFCGDAVNCVGEIGSLFWWVLALSVPLFILNCWWMKKSADNFYLFFFSAVLKEISQHEHKFGLVSVFV